MHANHADSTRFELEEKLRAAETFQQELAEAGSIPDVRRLLIRRTTVLLQVAGGLLLGFMCSVLAVLLTFVIFNVVFHI